MVKEQKTQFRPVEHSFALSVTILVTFASISTPVKPLLESDRDTVDNSYLKTANEVLSIFVSNSFVKSLLRSNYDHSRTHS